MSHRPPTQDRISSVLRGETAGAKQAPALCRRAQLSFEVLTAPPLRRKQTALLPAQVFRARADQVRQVPESVQRLELI